MIYEVLLFGFLGGVWRAVSGVMKYGVRNSSDAFWRFSMMGIVGIACAFAFIGYDNAIFDVQYKAFWIALFSYTGTDFLKSTYEIAGKVALRV